MSYFSVKVNLKGRVHPGQFTTHGFAFFMFTETWVGSNLRHFFPTRVNSTPRERAIKVDWTKTYLIPAEFQDHVILNLHS